MEAKFDQILLLVNQIIPQKEAFMDSGTSVFERNKNMPAQKTCTFMGDIVHNNQKVETT